MFFILQDVFRLLTPGGGGFGTPSNEARHQGRRHDPVASHRYEERGSVHAYRLAQESA